MNLPIILRPEAGQDLMEARDWYDRQRFGLGLVFAGRVPAVIETLGQFPEMYGILWRDVRAAPVPRHPHIVYYRIIADRVEVFGVLHGSRNPRTWQNRAVEE